METVHGKYEQRNMTQVATGQARVPVKLELQHAAKRVLSTTAACFVTGVERTETDIHVKGKVVTRVIFIDEFDGYNSEDRTDEFVERFAPKNIATLSSVSALAAIVQSSTIKTAKSDGDLITTVTTEHTINIGVNGLMQSEITFVQALKGDVETATQETSIHTWGQSFNDRFEIGETFSLDQNVDGIMGVELSAHIKDIAVADGKFTIKGIAVACVSEVRSTESGQSMSNTFHDFDFTKTFNKKDINLDDQIFGMVNVSNVAMKIENKTQPELVIEAEITFTGHSMVRHEIKTVSDAFSCGHVLDFAHATALNTVLLPQSNITADVEGNMTMPENSPYIAKVLWSSAPTIGTLNVKAVEDKVVVEGVLTSQIVYQCEEQNSHSHTIQVPFAVNVKVDGVRPEYNISAFVNPLSCNVKARRGKELLVDARIGVNVSGNTTSDVRLVSNVTLGAEKMRDDYAITIHVAAAGETLWDIAKRVSISTAEIVRQNPTTERGIAEGDRIFIYNRQK